MGLFQTTERNDMLLQGQQIVEVTVEQPGLQLSLECMLILLLRYTSKRLPMR
jgi:hypothetical protein